MKNDNELESDVITTEEIGLGEENILLEEQPKRRDIERPKKVKKKKKLFRRIINIILWIVLFGWMVLVIIDYINVNNNKEAQFCWFNEKVTTYDDGTVTECMGIGYKIINYKRASFNAMEFGPFWIKDRSANK